MTARLTADQARNRLRVLGVRRDVLRQQREQLDEDTAQVLVQTRDVLPVGEAAQLAGVARSTAYVLRGRGDGDDGEGTQAAPRSADGGEHGSH